MPDRETEHADVLASDAGSRGEARYLRFEDLYVDLETHRVRRAGQSIVLGPTEFHLLCVFLHHPTRAFTREQLVEEIRPTDRAIGLRAIDVHIVRLRRALTRYGQADPIRTIRTIGYALG